MLRGRDDAPLLARVNALSRRDQRSAAAQAHFDKHGHAAVLHDQINLTHAATVIAFHQCQAALLQKFQRELFRLIAARLVVLRAAQVAHCGTAVSVLACGAWPKHNAGSAANQPHTN